MVYLWNLSLKRLRYLGYGPQGSQHMLFPLTCCCFMVWLSCSNTFRSVGIWCLVLQVFCSTRYGLIVTHKGVWLWCRAMLSLGMAIWLQHVYAQIYLRLLCSGSLLYGIPVFLHAAQGGGDRISSKPRIQSMNYHISWSKISDLTHSQQKTSFSQESKHLDVLGRLTSL